MSKAKLGIIILGAALTGCTTVSSTPPAPDGVIAEWEAPLPIADSHGPVAWWSAFNDPTLDELIEIGQRNNVDLRLAAERVIAANAQRRAAAASWFPDIGGQASVDDLSNAQMPGGSSSATVGIGLAWEPDVSGRLSAAVRASRADAEARIEDAEAVRLLLIEEITRAYIEYRLQRTLTSITERTVTAQEETLRISRDRFEFGFASQLDVERSDALVAQTRSQLAVSAEAADTARNRLSYLLSTTPQEIGSRVAGANTIPTADPIDALKSPSDVLAARPDVRAAASRYSAFAARRDQAAALRLPALSLSGLVGLDADGLAGIFNAPAELTSVAAELVVPVFDFGRRRAELDLGDSRLREAGLDYERVVRLAVQDTQIAIVSYLQSQVRERELGRAAAAAQRASELSMLQFRAGTLSQLELLDAARVVYQAEREHVIARAEGSARLAILHTRMGVPPAQATTGTGD
jgi:NodT family efflux transporter outer membrane factor (OMF) lipoprotein